MASNILPSGLDVFNSAIGSGMSPQDTRNKLAQQGLLTSAVAQPLMQAQLQAQAQWPYQAEKERRDFIQPRISIARGGYIIVMGDEIHIAVTIEDVTRIVTTALGKLHMDQT